MSRADDLALLEAASSAYRERDRSGRILPSPAFLDLPPAARTELAAHLSAMREIERAFNRSGWSGTVQAVMSRILGM